MQSRSGLVVVACLLIGCAELRAQAPPPPVLTAVPFNILLPNYNSVAAGETAGLEANAFLARADDSSSAFFNAAGLALAGRTSVSGSAGVFQITSVAPEGLTNVGGSFQHIPSLLGVVVPKLLGRERWAGGFSLTRVNAWAQSFAGERQLDAGATSRRLKYTSASELFGLQASLGVGYSNGGKLRVGGSLDGQLTQFTRDASGSEQGQTLDGLSAMMADFQASAWAAHLRMSAGAQYDLTPTVRVGAAVRTPGLAVLSSGSSIADAQATQGAATASASYFEDDGRIEYRLPLEFRGGLAWVGPRAQIECDVLMYAAAGRYTAFRSDQLWTVITDTGSGGPPAVTNIPPNPVVIDSRAVANIAIGGHVRLAPGGSWRLHGGYATDRSPVGPDDTVFTRVNLQVVTLGVSGRARSVRVSAGLRHEFGTSDPLVLQRTLDGPQLSARLRVSNLGLVYSLAVVF